MCWNSFGFKLQLQGLLLLEKMLDEKGMKERAEYEKLVAQMMGGNNNTDLNNDIDTRTIWH